ncbi:hypothetical protein [Streptomyces sp. NPDC059597]|uniref:hypothetical protein n=1 Tax=Streptomyces sp. NPDC059597 TaxID=3346879 RepID=UPI00369B63EA
MEHSAAQPPPAPMLAPLFGPAPLHPTQQESNDQIGSWLSGAHTQPQVVLHNWATFGSALLPLGGRFAAVRIPADIVHTAVESDDDHVIAAVARDTLRGPLVAGAFGSQRTYWALVPWRPLTYWPDFLTGTPYLGPGHHLTLPALTRFSPPIPYWIAPPRYRYDLCSVEHVFNLIVRGAASDLRPD